MAGKAVTRSHIFNGLSEMPRLGVEYFDYLLNGRGDGEGLPRGNGQPVMFLPGFLTGDKVLAPMRDFFTKLGYNALGWECGTNWGSSKERIEKIKDRFESLIAAHPDQKIALVGWSLGGIYARELARSYPDHVSCVITLGAPFGAAADKTQINPVLRRIYEALNPQSPLMTDEDLRTQALLPPPVPTTSVFSKADGIVHWRASLNPETDLSENLDITLSGAHNCPVSHAGLKINRAVFTIIADRLAHAEQRPWRPFPRDEYPHLKACFEKAAMPQSRRGRTPYKQVTPSPLFK